MSPHDIRRIAATGAANDIAPDADDCFADLMSTIETLPASARVSVALDHAAQLVEFAAYETARSDGARLVSDLIMKSAELTRLSRRLALAVS